MSAGGLGTAGVSPADGGTAGAPRAGQGIRDRRLVLLPVLAVFLAVVVATGHLMTGGSRADDRAGGADRGVVGGPAGAVARQSDAAANPSAGAPSDPVPVGPSAGALSDPVSVGPSAAAAGPLSVDNPFAPAPPPTTGAPTRLRITSVGVDTTLEALRLDTDGALTPPVDFARAGWYADGTVPGEPGPAVIAGHVDSRSGPAVFHRLREVARGDRIEVWRGGRRVLFTVVGSEWYAKSAFPAGRVHGPTPDPQLRLITCGGVFDARERSYRDNLVVYAVAG